MEKVGVGGVEGARKDIGGQDVGRVRVWVSQEVGEGYGWERVVVGVALVVEFHHFEGLKRGML